MMLLRMAEGALVMLEGRMHSVIKEIQIPAVDISPALAKDEQTINPSPKLLKTRM